MGKYLYFIYATLLFSTQYVAAQTPACLGEQGKVQWYYYENISGSGLSSLYAAHSFPLSPNGFVELAKLQSPSNYNDNYGALTKGFIKAPLTGKYVFNMTGNQECTFFLSTTSNPSDTTKIARVPDFTNSTEHTKYAEQTSDTLELVAGQYYYLSGTTKKALVLTFQGYIGKHLIRLQALLGKLFLMSIFLATPVLRLVL
ncbi:MAG: hypothetical protein HC892_00615 [Saprospiraceae bacterium]|nr:hypothetical protein [Saprospiraceae bacterium]